MSDLHPETPTGATPATGHALTAWSDACAPGGLVCAVPVTGNPDGICGVPVESEPCGLHPGVTTPGQAAYEAWTSRSELDGDQDWKLWRELDDDLRAQWDDIADAVITAAPGDLATRRELTAAKADAMDYRGRLRAVVAERDEARRNLAAVKSVEASAEKFHRDTCAALEAELAACRERNAAIAVQSDKYRDERDDARDQLDEIRAMVDATRPHFSAEQLGIVLRAIHEAAGLEPQS